MKWTSIYLILIFALFSACSSKSTLYDSDYRLTNRAVKSTTTDLRVNVPKGWFFSWAGTDNLMDIWLIRDDYSASITFLPVYFEDQGSTKENISLDKIFELAKLKIESEGNLITNVKDSLVLNDNPLLAFEYTNAKQELSRAVLFSYNSFFYQCTAIILNSDTAPAEIFAVQNSVLKSAFTFK